MSHGETGADKFTCYEYNGGGDLTVLQAKACPPKRPERRRDGGNALGKATIKYGVPTIHVRRRHRQ